MDVEHPLPAHVGHHRHLELGAGVAFARAVSFGVVHAGAVDQHVDQAVLPVDALEHGVDRPAVGDVTGDRHGRAPPLPPMASTVALAAASSMSWQTSDAPSAANARLIARPSSSSRAGHHCDLAVQPWHAVLPCCRVNGREPGWGAISGLRSPQSV